MGETDGKQAEHGQGAPRRRRRRARFGLWLLLSLGLLVATAGIGLLALTGRPIGLPVWAVAEAEARLNAALPLKDASLSLERIEITVGRDWVPRLRLEDLRLTRQGGGTIVSLPEARVAFDPAALLEARLRPSSVVLSGMTLRLRRDAAGRFDLALGDGTAMRPLGSFAEVLDRVEAVLDVPQLAGLRQVEAEALSLTLEDARAGRVWRVGDGRLVLANDAETLGMELGLSLANPDGAPAQALLQVTSQKASSEARLRVTVDRVAARDIAAQSQVLALLSVLEAPISGKLTAALGADGKLAAFEGGLSLGAGALRPEPGSRPVLFDTAELGLGFDAAREVITLTQLDVQSPSLRVKAQGHVYAPGVLTGRPESFLAQVSFSQLMVDPEGLFTEPVSFTEGAVDMRLRLDPFRIEVGQFSLLGDGRRLQAKGQARADAAGWHVGLDLALDVIRHDRLLALWPVSAVPKTREWLVQNVQQGLLRNVKVALRLEPGAEPRFSLGYDFLDGDVRFLKTLPPIRKGSGYATIDGNSYTMVLDRGEVTPPEGGRIDMAGSVFSVLDILQKPAQAEIRLNTKSSLTAALSLLDQEPFRFLTKAGLPVGLGVGRAEVAAVLRLPLVNKVRIEDVSYRVDGRLSDVRSEVLVPGRVLTADRLELAATPAGLEIRGPGQIGKVPFEAVYRQKFGPEAKGRAEITGTAELSPLLVREFALGLPDGMLGGKGQGSFTLSLRKGEPPLLVARSDLRGVSLQVPELAWRKGAGAAGKLEVTARLGKPAVVEALLLEAPGLQARGRVSLRGDGGLDRLSLSELRVGDWLRAPVVLIGTGKGRVPKVQVAGGALDLRRLPDFGGTGAKGGGTTMDVALERLQVSDSIALTGLKGGFTTRGGFNGTFNAAVNGAAAVRGTVVQVKGGTAVRITSDDAGGVLAASGIFSRARGGALDLQLTPTGERGYYKGNATATNFRVRDAPLLAELLSAVSVVGILDQLNGDGLVFSNADAQFRLTPSGVEIRRGAAVGASMGVSMSGTYDSNRKVFDLQGVISPIYLLNGIGQIVSRRGEGLFGFNYAISGTVERASIRVNPLSIFTPGMFREIFRRPVPRLEKQG